MKFLNFLVPVLFAAFLVFPPVRAAGQKSAAEDYLLITAEELVARVNKGERVIFLDLRNEGAYKSSSKKIKGAIRIDQDSDLDTKLKDVPHDVQIVAYCT